MLDCLVETVILCQNTPETIGPEPLCAMMQICRESRVGAREPWAGGTDLTTDVKRLRGRRLPFRSERGHVLIPESFRVFGAS